MKNQKENKNRFKKNNLKTVIELLFQLEQDDKKEVNFNEGVKSLKYYYKNLRGWNPRLFYLGIFRMFPDMLIPVFAILLPTIVVKGLEEKWDIAKFTCYVGGLMVLMLIFNLINSRIQTIISEEKESHRFKYLALLCNKKMDVDYDILESQGFQDKQRLAYHWIVEWGNGPMERCISSPGIITACLAGIIVYGVILAQQNPFILIFIAISTLVTVAMSAKALRHEDAMWGKSAKVRRRMRYINNQVMDFTVGKDIRLFGMQKWFSNMFRKFLKGYEKILNDQQWQFFYESASDTIMVFVRDAVAYVYLIYQIAGGRLTVSDFVLYTSLVAGFSMCFRKCVDEMQWLVRGGYAFHAVKECLNQENKWKAQEDKNGKLAGSRKEALCIELKNVSFSYEGSEKPILDNINLKIKKGENLALVGLNGAGKTTLVKLLCGFYHPTQGEILVDGTPVYEYDRDEYYSMISAVFQDAQILPVSIAQNISVKEDDFTDKAKVNECLRTSGLIEKTKKLEDGENTLLVRELSAMAIDLSGGEKQKLLLSRALYKEAKFLILDEPTAALDPIAENEIYLKYRDLSEDKTSLFISHRLSSTRFCDRIILLENGQIVEEGTHDSLMEAGGRYAHMFEVQSRYYKEDNEKNNKMEEGDMAYV